MKKFKLILLIAVFLPLFSFAKSMPLQEKIFGNGELAILEFDKNSIDKILDNNESLPFISHPTNSKKNIILYPVSYYTTSNISLEMQVKDKKFPLTLHVRSKDYKKETLNVEPSKAKPSEELSKRIRAEVDEANKIYSSFTEKRYWDSAFMLPIKSDITSSYGNARVFNGELKSYHAGTDFRASIGSKVYAANKGKVVLAKERYLAGLSVIIDHGEGIYSCYFHLNKTDLKIGDMVEKGSLIGLSGNSGRVTGPHLHFSIVINGVPIDSILAINTLNSLFN